MTSKVNEAIRLTHDEWIAEAEMRFGPDAMKWQFECPACHHIASVQDYKDAGCPEDVVAFSCIGRWMPIRRDAFKSGEGPCNYAGGGLFKLNPVTVVKDGIEHSVMKFAGNAIDTAREG